MTQAPKKLTWLDEVRADADFNARRRVREAEEQAAYEASKAELQINKVVTDENEEVKEALIKNPSPLSEGKPQLTDDVKPLDEVPLPPVSKAQPVKKASK